LNFSDISRLQAEKSGGYSMTKLISKRQLSRIILRGFKSIRVVIPFHSGKILHPKTVQQVFTATESFEVERTEEEINQDEEDI
jgi:hypothetical protein